MAVWPARFGSAWRQPLPLIPHARLVHDRASTYLATYAEYRDAGRTKPREEPLAHRLGLSGSRRKRARLGGPCRCNPKAGPAAYLLLRGEGNSEDATSPASSASFIGGRSSIRRANVCSYSVAAMMLAGLRVPDDDVRELARLVDEPTRSVLEKALAFGTVVVALTIDGPRAPARALDDARTDALAELRAVLLREHEGRVRDGLV